MTSISGIIGNGIQIFATDFITGAIFRCLAGISIGFAAVVCPMYIGEMSPDEYRGRITASFNIFIGVGGITSATVGYFFLENNIPHSWKYLYALGNLPFIVFLIFYCCIPESSSWIEERQKKKSKEISGLTEDYLFLLSSSHILMA